MGTVNRQVEALGALPGVTVTGWVPDMAAELARADLAVAPILYGGGTRIKILEAFAHRLPVVSTTVGVEGLDAVAGRHLLVADDPRAFADACARALLEEPLRKGLVDEAERLFLERYQWARIRADAAELARAVARR